MKKRTYHKKIPKSFIGKVFGVAGARAMNLALIIIFIALVGEGCYYDPNAIGGYIYSSGNVTGIGTANTMTKWVAPTIIGDASMTEAQAQNAVNLAHTQGTDTTLGAMAANIDMNTHRIVNVVDPAAAQDAATKNYVDTVVVAGSGNVTTLVGGTVNTIPKFTSATNIENSSVTDAQVLSAVANVHTQGTDQGLDTGGANATTAAQVKTAVTNTHVQGTDTALGALGTKNPPIDADKAIYRNSAAGDALVTSTWTQIKAFLKTYFDTLYGAGTGNITGAGTSGYVTQWSGASTITNATNTDAQVASAVTSSHTQGTDTTLGAMTANINMNTHQITGLVDPTLAQDAATKNYVDTYVGSGNVTATGMSSGYIPVANSATNITNSTVTANATTIATTGAIQANNFVSVVATGTAPLQVASITAVTNLNADYLDGQHAPAGTIVGTTDAQTLTNKTLTNPQVNEAVNLTATSTQLNNAATNAHTQGTDTTLGTMTANISMGSFYINTLGNPSQAQDAATKSYVDTYAGTGNVTTPGGTSGIMTKFTGASTIGDSSVSEANAADAVSKKHTQGTDTTLGTMTANITMGNYYITGLHDPSLAQDAATKAYVDSLTSANITGAGTAGKIVKWLSASVVTDATNTDAEVADAVTKKHTQDTDTALGVLGTKNPPIDADKTIYRDSTAGDALVTSTWTQIKAFLKTYFDTLYGSGSGNVTTPSGTAGQVAKFDSSTNIINAGTAPSGDFAGTSDAQTITNKAFTTNNTYTNPNINEAVALTATSTQLNTAATLAHTQGTDTTLGTMTANISMGNFYINNLLDPSVAQDAATKNYVDTHAGTGNVTTPGGASGYIAQFTGASTIANATNTDAQVASTVAASHTQGTDVALGALGTKNPPIDADKTIYRDSTAADALVTSTWTQIKAFLKTYFDGLYGSGNVTATLLSPGVIPKATSATNITPSLMTDNSTHINISGGIVASNIYSNGVLSGLQLYSTYAIGNPPLVVVSTTKVDNLNADMVDGKHSTDVVLVDGTQAMSGNLTMGNQYINTLHDPSQAQDAATKAYVDTAISGVGAGTGNVTTPSLTATYIPVADSATNLVNSIVTANATAVASTGKVQGTQFVSTQATGTAPLQVSSITAVTNLNADYLDGQHAPTGTIVGTTDAQTLTNKFLSTNTTLGVLTEQGDIIYASAVSTPAALAHGTAGQVLQSGGHGANPSWTNASTGNITGSLTTTYMPVATSTTNLTNSIVTANTTTVAAAGIIQATRFVSTQATGTAPLQATSTTNVTNLNADMLDGQHGPVSAIVGIADTQTLTNKTLTLPTINTATISGGTITGNVTANAGITVDGVDISVLDAEVIKKAILTEQGDIIYASAASTPAALAHGVAGQFLTSGGHGANPSWAYWLQSKLKVGYYTMGIGYMPPGDVSVPAAPTANNLRAVPVLIPFTMTFDRIAIRVDTAEAGSGCYLGIYSDDGTQLGPNALLLDAGTVATTTTGVKAIAINQQLTPGIYWLALLSNATGTLKVHRTLNSFLSGRGFDDTAFTSCAYIEKNAAQAYGALPATFGTYSDAGSNYPWAIMLRVASMP